MREEQPLSTSLSLPFAKRLVQVALRLRYLATLSRACLHLRLHAGDERLVAQVDLLAQPVGPELKIGCAGDQVRIEAAPVDGLRRLQSPARAGSDAAR